jgi:hypothetical protein
VQVNLQKRTFHDYFIEQENKAPEEVLLAQPMSKRSKKLLDARESAEMPQVTRVQFEEVYAGSKSNSMSFAELRIRQN